MFSKLLLNVKGEEIEFTAHDLILAAHQVTQEKKAALQPMEVPIPDYASIDEAVDKSFWDFTRQLTSDLEQNYGLEEDRLYNFLEYAYQICLKAPSQIPMIVLHPQHSGLLNSIKRQAKIPLLEFELDEHIVIPQMTMKPQNIGQWVWVARYLKDHHLEEEHIKGWWFNVGGRIIRLRNDVDEGQLIEGNKQFYAADHGTVSYIMNHAQAEIKRCIMNFTWGDDGSYHQAFKFWMYFTQNRFQDFKVEFIERVGCVDIRDQQACRQVFSALGTNAANVPLMAVQPVVPADNLKERKRIYTNTFFRNLSRKASVMTTSDAEWLESTFIAELPIKVIEDLSSGTYNEEQQAQQQCDQLLKDISYRMYRPGVVPIDRLSDKQKKDRGALFDKFFKEKCSQHQNALKDEFMAHMNDDIAVSPAKCIRLLLSLGSVYKVYRGSVDDKNWSELSQWFIGERIALDVPEIISNSLDHARRERYGLIFNRLIEDFRYVTEAILRQRVDAMFNRRLSPFFTQVAQIMHADDAQKYILALTLTELTKAINHGKHDPIIREVSAYGDADSGDSYHKLARAVQAYIQKVGSHIEPELAKLMRRILVGEECQDEALHFLPVLTAVWFISETSRNELTTMTSLMLLDFIENQVFLNAGNGSNWYSWSNTLIHPLKSAGVGDVKDLYGRKCDGTDYFGGCHPMVNRGSVADTKMLPSHNAPLTKSRQKEGHLIIHWLSKKLSFLSEKQRKASGLGRVLCINANGEYIAPRNRDKLLAELTNFRKKRQDCQETIDIKRRMNPNDSAEKYVLKLNGFNQEIQKLETELNNYERIGKLKEDTLNSMIIPQLRQRLSSVDNLLKFVPEIINEEIPQFEQSISPKQVTVFFKHQPISDQESIDDINDLNVFNAWGNAKCDDESHHVQPKGVC